MSKKTIVYTDNERAIVKALKNAGDAMSIEAIKQATGLDIKPGHVVSAMRKGLIAKTGTVEVSRPSVRSVNTYSFVSDDIMSRENGKPFNYTDGEKAILAVAGKLNKSFTLAELAEAMGVEKLSSGSINGLVKKGNFAKAEPVEIQGVSVSEVGAYSFLADIPEGE